MFDFPASPAIGDVSNGYMWNGVGWAGGPIVATPQEQFFNIPAGATFFDIAVPTWATAVQLIGSVFTTNVSCNIMMRVSADGTTFFSGASDYTTGGPVHNTGSSAYTTVAAAASAFLYLSAGADQGHLVPHSFTAEMNLTRPSTAVPFQQKAYAKNYDIAAATVHRTFWHQGWLGAAVTAALSLKAIRIYVTAGTMAAGSWVKANWLGADVPQTNGLIPEAPLDGNEYVRVGGAWRLKRQQFDWTTSAIDIVVPAWGPKRATINFLMGKAAAGQTAVLLRVSVDGTTFLSGASDYNYSGVFGQGSSVAYQGITAGTFAYLTFDGDNISVGHQGTFDIELISTANSVKLYRGISSCYNNGAGILMRDQTMMGWLPSGSPIKALRFFLNNSLVPTAGSYVSAEWS